MLETMDTSMNESREEFLLLLSVFDQLSVIDIFSHVFRSKFTCQKSIMSTDQTMSKPQIFPCHQSL